MAWEQWRAGSALRLTGTASAHRVLQPRHPPNLGRNGDNHGDPLSPRCGYLTRKRAGARRGAGRTRPCEGRDNRERASRYSGAPVVGARWPHGSRGSLALLLGVLLLR